MGEFAKQLEHVAILLARAGVGELGEGAPEQVRRRRTKLSCVFLGVSLISRVVLFLATTLHIITQAILSDYGSSKSVSMLSQAAQPQHAVADDLPLLTPQ